MVLRENSANLLAQRFSVSVQTRPRLGRYFRVYIEFKILITGTSNSEVRTRIYYAGYTVVHGCLHHVIATSRVNIKCKFSVMSKNRKINNCINPLSRRDNSFQICDIELQVFIIPFIFFLYVSKNQMMVVLQSLLDIRS